MSGPFPNEDEIRAELARAHADIERTRADVEDARAELAATLETLSRERNEHRHRDDDAPQRPPELRKNRPTPASGARPIVQIAQAAKPIAVRAAGDSKRAALFAAGLIGVLLVLRRRRYRR